MEINIINKLILITFIVVNIIDISGVIDNIEKAITKWLKLNNKVSIHIIECSYCLNFWLSLLFLIITSNLTLEYISITLILSLSTQPMKELILNIKDILGKIIDIPTKYLN